MKEEQIKAWISSALLSKRETILLPPSIQRVILTDNRPLQIKWASSGRIRSKPLRIAFTTRNRGERGPTGDERAIWAIFSTSDAALPMVGDKDKYCSVLSWHFPDQAARYLSAFVRNYSHRKNCTHNKQCFNLFNSTLVMKVPFLYN